MKKFLSTVLAASMLMSMTAIGGVKAQTNEYTLEFEADSTKAWEKMYDAEGASGGDYLWIYYDQEADVSSTVSTTIEESGFYYVDVVAAHKGTNTYLSNMSLSINDGASTDFYNYADNKNNTAHITIADDMSFVAKASSEAKSTQLNNLVYLEKGENTFKVALAARTEAEGTENAGTYAGALDCVKLTKYELAKTSDSEATVEAEDFDWRYNAVAEPAGKYPDVIGYASGGGLINMRGGILDGLTYSFGVEATNAGFYTLDVYAACEATNEYLSTMKVAVNDDEATDLKGSTAITSLANDYLNNTYKVQSLKMNNPVYLNEGVNKITVTITASSKQSDKTRLLFALDCIKLRTFDDYMADSASLEFEDFYSSEIREHESASNGGTIWVSKSSLTSTERTVKAFVKEEGYYSLNLWAANNKSEAASATSSALSKMTLKINDTLSRVVTGSNFTIGSEALYKRASYYVYDFSMRELVYLKAGENELTIQLDKLSSNSACCGTLDCIKLERQEIGSIGNGTKVEAEYFDWRHGIKAENASASGESLLSFNNGQLSEHIMSSAVYAEAAGNYRLSVHAACEAGNAWLSTLKISINGGEAINLTGNTTATDLYAHGPMPVKRLELKSPVALNEGLNQFDIIATPSSGQDPLIVNGEEVDCLKFALDCIELVPCVTTVPAEGAVLEFEDVMTESTSVMNTADDMASEQKYMLAYFADPETENVSATFDLNVLTAGDYELRATVAANTSSEIGTMLSPVSISVNGGAAVVLDCEGDDANCELVGETYPLFDDTIEAGEYLLTTPAALRKGTNKITVTILADSVGTATAGLDCIELKKLVSFDNLVMDELEVCTVDAVQNIVLSNDGTLVTNEDVYQITYNSSNEDVAVVDGTGAVTANGMGTATISIAVYPTASTVTPNVVSQKITVVGADGLWVSDMSASNGVVSFKANAFTASEAAAAVVASYDSATGVLKSVDVVDVPAMSAGGSSTLSAELSAYTSADDVSIMLLDSADNIRPLWVKSEVQ